MPTKSVDIAAEFDKSIECMVRIHEAVDKYTANHESIVGELAEVLALAMNVSPLTAHKLGYAARLHDVGKISIDSEILNAPRALTPSEWEKIKHHSLKGENMLRANRSPFFDLAAEIAGTHHEYCDRSGYPRGIGAEQITRAAKIVTVCDVYEALRSNRSYKNGFSHMQAMTIFRHGDDRLSLAMFDSKVLEAFHRAAPVFAKIFDRMTVGQLQ